jgi:ABC-2 type transport system ATP-binding protein
VVLTTHFMEEAEQLADRVAIIDHGRLVALDTPAGLTATPAGEVRFSAAPGLDLAALRTRLGAAVRQERPGEYVVEAPPSPALAADLAGWLADQGVALTSLSTGHRRLEDVFLILTGEAE